MKKITLIAAAALVVLASCTKTQIIESPADQKVIGFENFLHKATKANTNTVETDLRGQNIDVNCYLMDKVTDPTSASLYFAENLTYQTGKWNTANVHYWPNTTWNSPTQSLSFFAVYPENNTFSAANYLTNPTNKPSFTYEVKTTSATQEDVLVASAENQIYTTNSTNGQVALQFDHALTQIVLQVRGQYNIANVNYKISAVSFGDNADKNAGTLKFNGTYTFGGAMVASGDATASYAYPILSDISSTGIIGKEGYESLGDDNAPLIIMPQEITTNKSYIHITYTATTADGVVLFNGTKKVALTAITWTSKQKVTYQITLPNDAREITYNVSVNGWTDATGGTLTLN